ncbi:MAG: hypothetical protein JSS21_07575 [Proteobacteria bacterium]|nr:hypothetical protein [Pseudomonadota bacterium]
MRMARFHGMLPLSLLVAACAAPAAGAATIHLFDQAPQFSIYGSGMPPLYVPPPGQVVLFDAPHQTWYTLVKLGRVQKQQLGKRLQAKVTYYGGCDAFDRIEAVAYIPTTIGVQPTLADVGNAVEMARFITPFNTYNTSFPTYVFPYMSLAKFAPQLAGTAQDIWVGIKGGSYPNYSNSPGTYNPCWDSSGQMNPGIPAATYPPGLTTQQGQVIFANTGFSFSLDLVSNAPAVVPAGQPAIAAVMGAPVVTGSSASIAGTIDVPDPGNGSQTVTGTLQVILTTHGNTEYGYFSGDSLLVNGVQVGPVFSTKADCDSFVGSTINPWNPTIDSGTTGKNPRNPRNWCVAGPVRTTPLNPGTPNPTAGNPGKPVQATVIGNVTLNVGTNDLQLNLGAFVTKFGSTDGSYPTSITFIPN